MAEGGGAAKPPPPGVPMTPTRMRLGTGRAGGAPAAARPPAAQPPPNEGPESLAQPDAASNVAGAPNVPSVDPARAAPAPPQPDVRPVADSTSHAATEGAGAGLEGVGAAADASAAAQAARPAPARAAAPAAAPPAAAAPAPSPAAPPPPPGDPEEIARLQEILPDLQWKTVHGYLELTIPKGRLLEVAQRLRDHLDYDYLSGITAVDWPPDRIELVYHLYRFNYLKRPTGVVLRVDLERPALPEYPLCPSLMSLWPGADFQEREIYDLMGVKFVGHPDLRRILLADDFPGHPLRKDFVFDYEYVLVRHLAYGIEGQFAEPQMGSRTATWSPN